MIREKTGKRICIILTPQECEILKNICMEVFGNQKWKISRERALIVNKILDKLEEIKK